MLSISRGKIARIISRSMSTPRVLPLFCSSFSFNDLWLFTVYRRFVLTPTNKKKKNIFVWMTLISVVCHVSPKISVFVLLVCSKVDWHKTLPLDLLVFIATRYSHCWGVLYNTSNTRKRQRSDRPLVTSRQHDNHIRLVHLWDRFQTSTLTTGNIPGLRPISSRTVHKKLHDRHVTSGHDIQQSVQFFCLGTVQPYWRGVDVIWDSEDRIGSISCSQMNPVST